MTTEGFPPPSAAGRFGFHCVYCGLPTPRPPACIAHDDLPALDDALMVALSAARAERPTPPEVSAAARVLTRHRLRDRGPLA